jgi:hypothetical protein
MDRPALTLADGTLTPVAAWNGRQWLVVYVD